MPQKETLKDKVIKTLEIDHKDRPEGGLFKFYDLGVCSNIRIPTGKYYADGKVEKTITDVERKKRDILVSVKNKLKEDLGDEYIKLTIEPVLKKPRYGASKDKMVYSLIVNIYGPDFEKILRKVGKNKNVKFVNG